MCLPVLLAAEGDKIAAVVHDGHAIAVDYRAEHIIANRMAHE